MKQGTAQPNVNAERMKELLIPFCPKVIQDLISNYLMEGKMESEFIKKIDSAFRKVLSKFDTLRSFSTEADQQATYLSELRQTILQEAIEGKLTAGWRGQHPIQPGDPETDAAALLAQIQAEKARLIAQKQIRPEQPLPPIREEEIPFALPVGWVWCRPSEITASESYALGIGPFGSDLKVSDYSNSGVPLIFVRNITQKDFSINLRHVSKEKAKALNAHIAKKNDLLITKMGDPPGACAIYPMDMPNGIITADCIRFRVHEQILNKYVYYSVQSTIIQMQLLAITKGMAQKKISLARFKSVLVPLPPLAEQRAIVERVDRLLALVDELAAQVAERKAQADALMQAVLREAFAG